MLRNIMTVTALLITTGGYVMSAGSVPSWVEDAINLNRSWGDVAFENHQSIPGLPVSTELPFSFVYGGKPSSELIKSWKTQIETKVIDKSRYLRTITLTDPQTQLEVKAISTIYTDTPGIEWTIYFTNKGNADTPVIEHVKALDISIKPSVQKPVYLHRLNGNLTGAVYSADDFLPVDIRMIPSYNIKFGPPSALSSDTYSPFFNLEWDGGGVITAVGWTGHWGATAEYRVDGTLCVDAGMLDTRLKLHPGESIRTPRIMQVYWNGNDHIRSYNLFRRTMFSHVLPRTNGKLVIPPVAHITNCFYSQNSGTEKEILEYIDSIKGLEFEYLWLDAFYMKDGWPDGVGNYGYPIDMISDPVRYPHGLKPISDAAHKAGMKFLLWTAPERAVEGTYLYEKHPEWLLGVPDQKTKLYNMGNPEAREYMTKYLIDLIKEYNIDCIRFDCGAFIGEMRQNDALEPDRSGMTEIRYHEGLYQMWDDILKAYPNVFIDNCCGGGNRIDLETCSRSLPLWRTDGVGYPLAMWSPRDLNQAALQNQVISSGLNRYVPFSSSGQMGTAPYLFRSAFNGGMPFAEDTRSPEYPKQQLKEAIAEGKRIRKYMLGDFYPLTEVTSSPSDWCVMQYNRSENQDGMIMAFRRHQSRFPSIDCKLYDIDPNSNYRVTYSYTYKPEKPIVMKGADLQNLKIDINEIPGSVIIEYRKLSR